MTRPNFDAVLIGELRRRVIEHNEAGGTRVKLGELKAIYIHNFRDRNPGARAIDAVDQYLAGLVGVSDTSERPGQPDDHVNDGPGQSPWQWSLPLARP
jgi:hypothetical protein